MEAVADCVPELVGHESHAAVPAALLYSSAAQAEQLSVAELSVPVAHEYVSVPPPLVYPAPHVTVQLAASASVPPDEHGLESPAAMPVPKLGTVQSWAEASVTSAAARAQAARGRGAPGRRPGGAPMASVYLLVAMAGAPGRQNARLARYGRLLCLPMRLL